MNSVISFPDRGPYGKSSYHGNTSGYVIKELIEHFNPTLFVDVCQGSGTSGDVCREMGIEYVGLDIHTGFDFTNDSVLKRLPRPADLVFSHPPYHDMVNYEAERKKHGLGGSGRDISRCVSVEEFLELSQTMLLNQREATKQGGFYTTLIGDMRKDGQFRSFQADYIKMLPTSELISVVCKVQHNTQSSYKQYRKGNFIPIMHEYLVVWRRGVVTLAQLSWDKAKEQQESMNKTWRNFIRLAIMELGGQATLDSIYRKVEQVAESKVKGNPNYQAKIRQILQYHFDRVGKARYAVAAA